ncbi:putative signal transduction histidine kinase [Candidatus Moduliflexus flocculans]|uniref:histidine kinase n=1 Tax=Candidatus Moduliflexus flocculans TaxID=1499966 RepID=A0A081BPP0_9BACT|nr:putative signal transduction histidine kinase [Candidatus Moduliflexus flocculans]
MRQEQKAFSCPRCAELSALLQQQEDIARHRQEELDTFARLLQEKDQELMRVRNDHSLFLSNISHELRTPLNSILILSEIFAENRDNNLTEKQQELARTIYQAGTALSDLVNEFLDFTVLEAHSLAIHVEDISVQTLCDKIAADFSARVAQKGLRLLVDIAEDLPSSIRTDRQQIHHIIHSLMSNAIKFTPSKGEIRLSFARPEKGVNLSFSGLKPQMAVAISVSDTGIGIPEDKLQTIFEAFHQLDSGLTRKYEGAGLGLAVTRGLTHALGGELHVRSVEGQGSVFTVYVPEIYSGQTVPHIVSPRVLQDRFPQHELAQEERLLAEIGNIRDDRHRLTPYALSLLIIENDPGTVKLLFEHAHTNGFQCLIAEDGEAGMQLAEQYHPDAILLNLGLPGLNGWKVMARFKDNFQTRHIPIYIISSQKRVRETMKMGALGYVRKPLDLNACTQMFRHVRHALSSSHKALFLFESPSQMFNALQEWMRGTNVQVVNAEFATDVNDGLSQDMLACVVVNLTEGFEHGVEILNALTQTLENQTTPVVVYHEHALSFEQEMAIKTFEPHLILKKVYTPERLLDEVSLFLHLVISYFPASQQKMLELLHPSQMSFVNKQIFLIDDDMRSVFALSGELEGLGAEVVIAESPEEAERLLHSLGHVDAILLNVMLPGMDEFAFLKKIRETPTTARIPVLVMKADGVRGDRRRYIKAGANDYLSKPVDTNKLLSLLRVWLY